MAKTKLVSDYKLTRRRPVCERHLSKHPEYVPMLFTDADGTRVWDGCMLLDTTDNTAICCHGELINAVRMRAKDGAYGNLRDVVVDPARWWRLRDSLRKDTKRLHNSHALGALP